jgi:hypothetical protein
MKTAPEAFAPDGRTDDRGGGGARRPRRDAQKDRRLLRGRGRAAVKVLTSILEPVMIVLVGIVGFIVISMYMPMFKVYDQIK